MLALYRGYNAESNRREKKMENEMEPGIVGSFWGLQGDYIKLFWDNGKQH